VQAWLEDVNPPTDLI